MRRGRRIRRRKGMMVKNWGMGEGIGGRIMDESRMRRRRGMNRITEVL